MDSVGEGEGWEIWENSVETCIISCMKRVASPGSMHDTVSRGLSRVEAGNPGFPRLVQVTSGGFSRWL